MKSCCKRCGCSERYASGGCVVCSKKRASAHAKAHPGKFRIHGVSEAQFAAQLAKQNGVCAICKRPDPGDRWGTLAIDHNHATKKFRGLLCGRCNRAIGFLQDSPALCIAAAQYLKETQ